MPYALDVFEDPGYISVRPLGELTKPDIDKALAEILRIRHDSKIDAILCDQRGMTTPPSTLVVHETAVRFSEKPFMGMRLAILRDTLPKEMHLFKTTATNRFAHVEVFDDETAARTWLGVK